MNNKGHRRQSSWIYKKTTSEIICENMEVETQTIFQDFRCTYKEKISYFGRLYVGEQHIMFVSSMFGILKKIAIPVSSISRLEEISHKSILLAGVRLQQKVLEQFLFTGLSKNHAYNLIKAVWRREKVEASLITNNEEEKENSGQANALEHLDSSQIQISLFNASGGESQKVKMLQIVFPCSVQQFYTFFLSDNAQLYGRKKHLQQKNAHTIEVTPWKKNDQLKADTREITAVLKVKGVPLMSEARMSQVCVLSRNQKLELNLKVITNMDDVPYHSYFNCEEYITVTADGDHRCKYTVYAAVIFNKSTYMKSHIISKTFADFNEDYKLWSDNCKKYLQAKRLEIEEKSKKEEKHSEGIISVQFEADKHEIKENEKQSHTSNSQNDIKNELLRELKEIKKELSEMKSKQKLQNLLIWICIATLLIGFTILFRGDCEKTQFT